MIWKLRWGFAARTTLRALPLPTAERVDAAVIRLAEDEEGTITYVPDIHPMGGYLHVGSMVVFFTLEPKEGVMTVWNIFRRRRLI
ncbi:MAG: hypothetical protein IPK82_07270 [Polyangiaceae bacterium]|nr:hypothetical protein [Polyangiaceae bacterium]